MSTTTTLRSPEALLLGLFFTAVTACTIFNDVLHGAAFTIAHLNAGAALVAAVAAGHMALPSLWRGRIAPALGLAIIFIASAGYIVTSAGARNAEAAQAKATLILKANAEREAARKSLAEALAGLGEAKSDYERAKRDAAVECASGKKTRCEGKSAIRDYAAKDLEKAESHVTLKRGQLSVLGPEEVPFAGYRHAAAVFEAAGLGEAQAIEARLELLLPFVLVLISEVGTLVFFGLAFGNCKSGNHRQPDSHATVMATDGNRSVSAAEHRRSVPTVAVGNSERVASKAAAEADLMRLVASSLEFPSQDTLAARWGVHKGTASKWLHDFESRGLILRRRQGRVNLVVPA